MNRILIIVLIFIKTMTNAQNNTNIVGTYSLGPSSPEGGASLFVLEDGRFAITYFGGIQTGKWDIIGEKKYKFTLRTKETIIELYGRHNIDIGNNTRVAFEEFENGEAYIQLRENTGDDYNMQPVFNADANCFSYPYVHTFKKTANNIAFLSLEYGSDNNSVLTFKNPNGYNDFVAKFNTLDTNAPPFFTTFKNNTLYFEDGKSSERFPLRKDDEDLTYLIALIDRLTADNSTLYINPSYNVLGGLEDEFDAKDVLKEYYTFNTKKNAFINSYYSEGSEYIESDNSFDDMSIIYSFQALKEYTIHHPKYELDNTSLFHVICD